MRRARLSGHQVLGMLVLGLVLLGGWKPAVALSCAGDPPGQSTAQTVAAARQQATAVFRGRVTSVDSQSGSLVVARLVVTTRWVGPSEPELTVTTPRASRDVGGYGIPFVVGEEYLLGPAWVRKHLTEASRMHIAEAAQRVGVGVLVRVGVGPSGVS